MDDRMVPTASGRWIDLLYPRLDDFAIQDIARSLALQCRFNGNCVAFYSVAQHCVLVSEHVSGPVAARWGLLHDAGEMCLGDMVRPWKQRLHVDNGVGGMFSVSLVERRHTLRIAQRFDLPANIPTEVELADLASLATECRDICPNVAPWPRIAGVKPWPERITPWQPAAAEARFLERFRELWGVET